MNRTTLFGALLTLAVNVTGAAAEHRNPNLLDQINQRICGQVVDYTCNHGADRRIWSEALQQKRGMYVYLPPGFDPGKCYPLIIYLHGFSQDAYYVLKNQVEDFDQQVACGKLPPVILVAPDGSIQQRMSATNSASFFANSHAGNFEDFLMVDVWNFLFQHYPLRPEREAHVILGASQGGSGAYHLGVKHRDRIGVIVGVFPAVNLRWVDCHGQYKSRFDPCCWGWRTELNPNEVIARYLFHLIPVRYRNLSDPTFGRGPDALAGISAINPIEVIDHYDLHEGEVAMWIGYGGRDEFHMDAEVESFLYHAHERGLTVAVEFDPKGKHDLKTGTRLFHRAVPWLAPLIAPYSPPPAACVPAGQPTP